MLHTYTVLLREINKRTPARDLGSAGNRVGNPALQCHGGRRRHLTNGFSCMFFPIFFPCMQIQIYIACVAGFSPLIFLFNRFNPFSLLFLFDWLIHRSTAGKRSLNTFWHHFDFDTHTHTLLTEWITKGWSFFGRRGGRHPHWGLFWHLKRERWPYRARTWTTLSLLTEKAVVPASDGVKKATIILLAS